MSNVQVVCEKCMQVRDTAEPSCNESGTHVFAATDLDDM